MISISHKTKQFQVLAIKLLIVGVAFYYIYEQLINNSRLDWGKFKLLFQKNYSFWSIIFLLFLSFLNRFLEILKWQNLVSSFQQISIFEATKQVLGALTLSVFTPNGIGEYAGKAFFYDKKRAKKIVFLNLICNGIQLILTVVFGLIGLWILGLLRLFEHNSRVGFWVLIFVLVAFAFCLLPFAFRKIAIKGYSLQKLIFKINEIRATIHQKNMLFGLCRYLVFSHQYYYLFLLFDVHLSYFSLMATIATVYLLASSLPSFQFLDFAVKGSVAVYFFGNLGINDWIVFFITTLMWFLNVVLPVVVGCYFVLNFKPKTP